MFVSSDLPVLLKLKDEKSNYTKIFILYSECMKNVQIPKQHYRNMLFLTLIYLDFFSFLNEIYTIAHIALIKSDNLQIFNKKSRQK